MLRSASGVVPAAGGSTRMGSPKGLLELEGVSFVRRVVRTLREGGCEPVLVVVRSEDAGTGDEAARSGATTLVNPEPGDGPITSLRRVLEVLDETVSHVVWLPLDHPMVRPETVTALLDEAEASGAPITLPLHEDQRGHPAVFERSIFPELLDPSLQGGARTVVHRNLDAARLVPVTDPGVLVDIDTPEEYRALVRRFTGTRPPGGEPA